MRTTETTEIDPRAALMAHAEKTMLELDMLEDDVRDRGVSIPGARGNMIANPSLAAIARHRTMLAKLLQALEAPESTTELAKRAARARWDKAKTTPRPLADVQRRVFVPNPNGNDD